MTPLRRLLAQVKQRIRDCQLFLYNDGSNRYIDNACTNNSHSDDSELPDPVLNSNQYHDGDTISA